MTSYIINAYLLYWKLKVQTTGNFFYEIVKNVTSKTFKGNEKLNLNIQYKIVISHEKVETVPLLTHFETKNQATKYLFFRQK